MNREIVKAVSDLGQTVSTTFEAGCGSGVHSASLAKAGYSVSVLDFSENALKIVRRLFDHYQLPCVDIFQQSLLSPVDKSYDLVFNVGTLEHYDDEEIVEVLTAMGRASSRYVLCIVPNAECQWYWIWRHKVSQNGDWIWGKEIPRSDMSAFDGMASLRYVGKRYFGHEWSKTFIRSSIQDPQLRNSALAVFDLPVLPPTQTCYLVGFLFSQNPADVKTPPQTWRCSAGAADGNPAIVASIIDLSSRLVSAEQEAEALCVKTGQVDALNQALADRDGQIAELDQAAAEREARITELNQALTERDDRIAELDQVVADRDGQIAELDQAVADRDGQIDVYKVSCRELRSHSDSQAVKIDGQQATLETLQSRDGVQKSQIHRLAGLIEDIFEYCRGLETHRSYRFAKLLQLLKHPELMGRKSALSALVAMVYRTVRRRPFAPDVSLSKSLQAEFQFVCDAILAETQVGDGAIAPGQYDVIQQVDNFLAGGLENVVIDLATVFRTRGFPSTILVGGEAGPAVEKARKRGINVICLKYESQTYRNVLKRQGIKVVFAHYSLDGADICAKMNIPFVQVVHNYYVWLNGQQKAAFAESSRYTNVFVCVSQGVADYVSDELGVPRDKCVVVPNASDVSSLFGQDQIAARRDIRNLLGIAEDDFVFLNVASMTSAKNQEGIIEAFHRFSDRLPQTRIVFLGRIADRGYWDVVSRKINQYGLDDRVIYAGEADEPNKYFYAADAFLLPSFIEGCSLALQEALFAGLPVIASEIGSAIDLAGVEGVEIIRRPCEDFSNPPHCFLSTEAFQDELGQALVKMRSSARPVRMNRKAIELLNPHHAYRPYIDIYTRLLNPEERGKELEWSLNWESWITALHQVHEDRNRVHGERIRAQAPNAANS